VTNARDIQDMLAPIMGRPMPSHGSEFVSADDGRAPEPLPNIHQSERGRIVGALGPSPVDIDELIRVTGIEVRKVHIVLWSSTSPAGSSGMAASSCL